MPPDPLNDIEYQRRIDFVVKGGKTIRTRWEAVAAGGSGITIPPRPPLVAGYRQEPLSTL
jgi:hypothetical protein